MNVSRRIALSVSILLPILLSAGPRDFNRIPFFWKWLSEKEVAFTYDGTFTDEDAFSVNVKGNRITKGIKAPARYAQFPVNPEGAVNLTYSPDSTMLAFTRANDLYVVDVASGEERRLTFDGDDLILNGYASWVYYEEIFGRPSRYRAFWWSPDSKKLAFYRFDNSQVPMFPIYSAKGQDGSLRQTRYPKAGEPNPKVRIGIIDITRSAGTVWADFNEEDDQYFGTPFWGADSKEFFVSREPRIQNTLDLYSISPSDGSKKHIYHEQYKTWLDWIDGMVFGKDGLYMARSFETGWSQIYYLSYDGKTLKHLTDGPNWRVSILRVDENTGDVFFTAERDSRVRQSLYKVDRKGRISALTDTGLNVSQVSFSPDGKHFVCSLSNLTTPNQIWLFNSSGGKGCKVADMASPSFDPGSYSLPRLITLTTKDGLELPATVTYPKGFVPDGSVKYPVHMDIYGGPDSPQVNDRWRTPNPSSEWWSENGIIEVYADCRASGHNGREGLDQIYRHLADLEIKDFVEWAEYFQSLPYVKGDKIGVEGFSFGGTMTTLLVCTAPDKFHYGIAGGGVYDWALYDTHYTERFMESPQTNPEGYRATRVIDRISGYPTKEDGKLPENGVEEVMLKITHGTGDDNVHFQNTLQLIDKLQEEGKRFEFMIYPDGMHGYRGYQGRHFNEANRTFWLKYLKNQ